MLVPYKLLTYLNPDATDMSAIAEFIYGESSPSSRKLSYNLVSKLRNYGWDIDSNLCLSKKHYKIMKRSQKLGLDPVQAKIVTPTGLGKLLKLNENREEPVVTAFVGE